jgi:hypothetical protein
MESFKTHIVRPPNKPAFRVLVLRCSCGITVNTSWRYAKTHWAKHVAVMKRAAVA